MTNMRRRFLAAAALMLTAFLVFTPRPTSGQQADPAVTKAVTDVLDNGIRLLEAKDYAGFLRTCLRPSEVEELVEQFETIEKAGEAYAQTDRPAGTLAALKAARAMTPAFTQEGMRAEFAFAQPIGGERRLQLQKIDGRWYLRD